MDSTIQYWAQQALQYRNELISLQHGVDALREDGLVAAADKAEGTIRVVTRMKDRAEAQIRSKGVDVNHALFRVLIQGVRIND